MKTNLIITGVGRTMQEYFLNMWLDTPASDKFNPILITDQALDPNHYPSITKHQYFGSRFNYHDKLIYALHLITVMKEPAFVWDMDELWLLDESTHLYDQNTDIPQFSRLWYPNANLGEKRCRPFHYLMHFCKKNGVEHKDAHPIQEDKLWFPALDYTHTISIIEKVKSLVDIHQGKRYNKWYVNGYGEGMALGIALKKSNIPFRLVGEYK